MHRAAELRDMTCNLVEAAKTDQELPYWVADDYLRAVAVTLLAWAWLQIGEAAKPTTSSAAPARWTEPATALRQWILPEFDMRLRIIKARLEEIGMLTSFSF
jgi:hypothetical protein